MPTATKISKFYYKINSPMGLKKKKEKETLALFKPGDIFSLTFLS